MIVGRLDLEGGHRYVLERLRGGFSELQTQRRNPDMPRLQDRIERLRNGLRQLLDDAMFSEGEEQQILEDRVQHGTGKAIALAHFICYPGELRDLFCRYKTALDFCKTNRYVMPQDVALVFDSAEEDPTRRAWETASNNAIDLMRGSVARNRTDAKLFVGIEDEDAELLRQAAFEGSLDAQYHLALHTENGQESNHAIFGAARQGHSLSQAQLGKMALDGEFDEDETLEPSERFEYNRQALAYLHQSADTGNREAQYLLGNAYFDAKRVPNDAKKALYYLRRAADSGDQDAQYELATHIIAKSNYHGDLAEAFTYCARAANRGVVRAQVLLGKMYRDGKGVASDPAAAQAWFRNAYLRDDADGAYEYVDSLLKSGDASLPAGRMREICGSAADGGHAGAQRLLAQMLQRGLDGPRDNARSKPLYVLAAGSGDAEAQYVVAQSFFNKNEPNRDPARGIALLEQAAQQRHAKAAVLLAHLLATGKECTADPVRAFEFAHAAALCNDGQAQWQVAEFYRKGYGTEKNDTMAYRFMHAGARSDVQALGGLGHYQLHGTGCKADAALAITTIKRAAEAGHARSQGRLGQMYAEGIGCSVDDREAFRWYKAAADQGESGAFSNVGQLYLSGKGVEKDYARALEYLLKDYTNVPHAAYLVGVMRERGFGKPVNSKLALASYIEAAERGHITARFKAALLLTSGADATRDQTASCALARTWLELPELADHARANHLLARLYNDGRGGPKYPEKVHELLEKASAGGWLPASFDLGFSLQQNATSEAERERGLALVGKAAEGGLPSAQYYLGKHCMDVEHDEAAAVRWFEIAAGRGNEHAAQALAALRDAKDEPQAKRQRRDGSPAA